MLGGVTDACVNEIATKMLPVLERQAEGTGSPILSILLFTDAFRDFQ